VTRVKICGLRTVEHAVAAVEAGADMVGFIFYPAARRYVEPELARAIVRALPAGSVELFGVFANETPERMNEIAELVGLDRIQLSGDEPAELNGRLARPVARTVHVDAATTSAEIVERARGASLIHLDTKKSGQYGGTGATFDWEIARSAAELGPVLLAGGLDSINVAEAIAVAAPWGVDVSSGVETDGVKDPAKIQAFVRAARVPQKAELR
jgi:phosphoribosylanthranilate isomerase